MVRQQEAGDAETSAREARPSEARGDGRQGQGVQPPRPSAGGMQFGLMFFSADGSTAADDKYGLLLESSAFADRAGFSAVWTPERHFQDFGGLYPNPAVLGAALAMTTGRIRIRAGSVALPLHHPVRVAVGSDAMESPYAQVKSRVRL